MRVLLTAFEPFDESGVNASLEGCRAFLSRWSTEFDVRFGILPVEYGPDVEVMDRLLQSEPADLILHTGQAAGAHAIRVETRARNRRYHHHLRRDPGAVIAIREDAPLELASNLPADRLVQAINAVGIPAVASDDAGIYLCNHTLYQSLLRLVQRTGHPRVGFLHVPALTGQFPNSVFSLAAEQIAAAIRACLVECARDALEQPVRPAPE